MGVVLLHGDLDGVVGAKKVQGYTIKGFRSQSAWVLVTRWLCLEQPRGCKAGCAEAGGRRQQFEAQV